jgi:hypothetical protein
LFIVGRWQQGKDIQWYAHDKDGKKKLNDEFTKAKEMEEKALMAALGYKVVDKPKPEETPEKEESYSKRSYKEEREPSSKSFESKDTDYLDKMLIKFLNKYGFDQVIDALKTDDKKSKKKKKKEKKHHKSSKKSKKSSRSSNEDSSSSSDENDHRNRASNKRKDKSKSQNGGSLHKKSRHSSSTSESSNSSSESD